ncbi:MAG: nucleotide sugar dehydrogenase [Candidatus Euphemobacter frigidus]|nr:nucleotide sugar dehydrogenase [Candidatus Euphemobacter frigidus]MDP8276732.1 nucleotide sugar dehydrogenase [Candidatus Euphemobacter frigidus]
MNTKIAVIGMGYVGIPAAALLADVADFEVTGLQRRSKRSGWKIEVLNSGRCPFEGNEPGLDELIARVVEKGTFRVTDDYSVLKEMDIILLDVQTPTEGHDHQPRYESLKEVSARVGKYMKKGVLVITESTVAPGTTRHIVQPILESESGLKAGRDFSLAYSYERVMPGKLIEYIVNLPRIVGGIDKRSEERAVKMYSKIVKKKIYSTDVLTAETSKTMENAYRDVNIAFANEMAMIAEKLGVDIYEIQRLINSRSERNMHLPGAGVGGHCLPKDTWLLRYGLRKYWAPTMETEFVCLARKINDLMPLHLVELIQSALKEEGRELVSARVAILGVAYLEDSDDTRNTPAYSLIYELKSRGAEIIAHDPHVREFPEAELTRDLDEALKGADCAVIVTKHKPYFSLDLKKVKSLMRTPILIDGRNVLAKEQVEAAGFIYRGIGKGK